MARTYTIIQNGYSRTFEIDHGVGPRGPSGADGLVSDVKSADFTAENDKLYHVNANATVTDPSPVLGKGYCVLVINGTTTIGGTGYAAKTYLKRVYHSGAWLTIVYPDKTAMDTAYATAAQGTDARTPLAHKTSHATGGSDALTAADVGAAATSHTHVSADVTDASTGAPGNDSSNSKIVKFGATGELRGQARVSGGTGVFGVAATAAGATGIGVDGAAITGTGGRSSTNSGTHHHAFGTDGNDRSFVARVLGAFGWWRGAFNGRIQATSTLTADRTWNLPDKDGTVAMTSDITGTNSGTNTGDQDLSGLVPIAAITTDADDRTLALTDAWDYIRFTNATATVLTIPTNASVAFAVGTQIYFRRSASAGAITLSNAGVTVNGGANISAVPQSGNFALVKIDTDTWDFI